MKIYFETHVHQTPSQIFSQFDQKLFEALKPPLLNLRVKRFDGSQTGDEIHLEIGLGPFKMPWVSVITDDRQEEGSFQFVDQGKVLPWPLKSWHHHHVIKRIDDQTSAIIDDIDYSSGYSWVDYLLFSLLWFQFRARKPIYKRFFDS